MSAPPPSPCEPAVAMFGGAAARAAMFELRARMLVDVIPELSGSITMSLDPLVRQITEWMACEGRWTADDQELLKRSARLRNKIFHAEFSRATGQLVMLDVELEKEGVRMFTLDSPGTAEKLVAAIEASPARTPTPTRTSRARSSRTIGAPCTQRDRSSVARRTRSTPISAARAHLRESRATRWRMRVPLRHTPDSSRLSRPSDVTPRATSFSRPRTSFSKTESAEASGDDARAIRSARQRARSGRCARSSRRWR